MWEVVAERCLLCDAAKRYFLTGTCQEVLVGRRLLSIIAKRCLLRLLGSNFRGCSLKIAY
jgi:hypothetical protein